MNHPKKEEWVSLLYNEAKGETRRQLVEHLRSCPECRQEFDIWKRSMAKLDAWSLPRWGIPRESFAPLLRWAIAGACAGLVLLAGVAIGRLNPGAGVLFGSRNAL